MAETRRRDKAERPVENFESHENRTTQVTLSKNAFSKYRKVIPQTPWANKDRPERRGGGGGGKPFGRGDSHRGRRPEFGRPQGSHLGPFSAEEIRAVALRELPEIMQQVTETQELLLNATQGIMDQFQALEEAVLAVGKLSEEVSTSEELKKVQEIIFALYPAMSFQDLSGQRLQKIAQFCQALESIFKRALESLDNPRPSRPSSFGERRPFGGDRDRGERRPFGGDRDRGERRSFGGDRDRGERRPFGGDREGGERRPFGGGDRDRGERRPFGGGDRDRGERRSFGGGERRGFSDRDRDGGRPSRDRNGAAGRFSGPPPKNTSELKGPQAAGGGMEQTEIDNLLSKL